MSHLKERKQKNCLNCNAQVYGKYCHICGQENVEPAESLWHLVTHFFNDITHFDGKFFSTLRLLLIKPGFLSTEYKMGRRNSYLNPVKMYVFTSFVFFFVFFSAYTPEKDIITTTISVNSINELTELDEASYEKFKNDLQGMNVRVLTAWSIKYTNLQNLPKQVLFNLQIVFVPATSPTQKSCS
ncbi:MAG TPA: DUF3667 domain-containing protein [Ferruginibacter sp.]|nr:DUF3667 domain-containing protein [Ferruginibacter sp.]